MSTATGSAAVSAPTRPKHNVDEFTAADDDLGPLLNLVGGGDRIKQQLMRDDEEIMKLVRGLGGSRRACEKEKAKSMKAIVSEIDSPPRVTHALKPGMGLIPGFALDLATNDGESGQWATQTRRRF